MNLEEISTRMAKLRDWSIEGNSIVKDFNFQSAKEAMIFVNNVAEISEKQNHHPSILIDHTFVRLRLTTHDEHGISEKDFIIAEEIDKL